MKYIAVALLLSILLFDAVIGDGEKAQTRDKRAVPHAGLINPADLGMRLKSRRSDPFRRAPRIKRYRRMAEDAGMFKRGPTGGGHIRVKKSDTA